MTHKEPALIPSSNTYQSEGPIYQFHTDQKKVLFVSFYTPHTPYEKEVQSLINSLKTFELSYFVMGVRTTGSWAKNTLLKVYFIKDVLNSFPNYKAVVWLDADSILQKKPELFFNLENTDFAVRGRGPRRNMKNIVNYSFRCFSKKGAKLFYDILRDKGQFHDCFNCVMYFGNTAITKQLLNGWIDEIENPIKEAEQDQQTLNRCLIKHNFYIGKLRLASIPSEYVEKFDKLSSNTVIKQNQASRRFKNAVGV